MNQRGGPYRPANTKLRRIIAATFLLALVGNAPSAVAGEPFAAQEIPAPTKPDIAGLKTLRRRIDPVVMAGTQLPDLLGRNLRAYILYAYDAEKGFYPVPSQFDEREAGGGYVFEAGPDAGQDEDKGLLDGNDEFVFMASDTGGKAPPEIVSQLSEEVVEITVVDPVDGSSGWAYLAPAKTGSSVFVNDYVSLSEASLEISARDYLFRFCKKAPIAFDYLAVRHEGEPLINIVDRLKIRAWARLLGLFKIPVNEEDLDSKLRGYIDGPVRVIRRSRNTYHIAIIPTLRTDSEGTFYRGHFMFDMTGKMPVDASTLASSAELRVGVDYTKDILGATFYTGSYLEGVLFDGKPQNIPAPAMLASEPYRWGAIYGFGPDKKDGWFSRMIPGPTLPDWFMPYVSDSFERNDPPEREPGVHDIGFISDRMTEMKAGHFSLRSYLYKLRDFTLDQRDEYLNVTDKPLEARSRRIAMSAVVSESPTDKTAEAGLVPPVPTRKTASQN